MAEAKIVKRLVVTAPLVAAKDDGGRVAYLYRGASTEGIAKSEVDRLMELGLVGVDETAIPWVAVHPSVNL